MKERISYQELDSDFLNGMNQTEVYLKKSGFDQKLLELIKYRVSQINGCAYCIDMHHKEAIHMGETELRLHSLAAWRECSFYSDEEKAAFTFAEELTKTIDNELSDEVFEELASYYSKQEVSILTLAITQINAWNRFAKTFKITPGNYVVGQYG